MSFLVNMVFVIVSRTALVTMPIMLAVFALLHLKWRSNLVMLCAGDRRWRAWRGRLRRNCARTIATFDSEYQLYKERNQPTSIGDAAGILAKVAAVLCRGADHRARHGIDARACSSRPPPGQTRRRRPR